MYVSGTLRQSEALKKKSLHKTFLFLVKSISSLPWLLKDHKAGAVLFLSHIISVHILHASYL